MLGARHVRDFPLHLSSTHRHVEKQKHSVAQGMSNETRIVRNASVASTHHISLVWSDQVWRIAA